MEMGTQVFDKIAKGARNWMPGKGLSFGDYIYKGAAKHSGLESFREASKYHGVGDDEGDEDGALSSEEKLSRLANAAGLDTGESYMRTHGTGPLSHGELEQEKRLSKREETLGYGVGEEKVRGKNTKMVPSVSSEGAYTPEIKEMIKGLYPELGDEKFEAVWPALKEQIWKEYKAIQGGTKNSYRGAESTADIQKSTDKMYAEIQGIERKLARHQQLLEKQAAGGELSKSEQAKVANMDNLRAEIARAKQLAKAAVSENAPASTQKELLQKADFSYHKLQKMALPYRTTGSL